jgi:hypothetical protein
MARTRSQVSSGAGLSSQLVRTLREGALWVFGALALALIQTGKCRKRPILLFGREFWSRLINFDLLIETGMISPGDVDLFHYVESAEEAWALLENEYGFDDPATETGDLAVDI